MNKAEAKTRIEKLKKIITHHRYQYHVLDKIEITDAALDSLKNELQKLEYAYPDLISSDSPTQRVGGRPLDKFTKHTHSSPMLSLFDSFSEKDIVDWQDRMTRVLNSQEPVKKSGYFCELKLDGLAVSLNYVNGIFKIGATRGDGKIGEDVTSNLRTINSIPLKIRIPTNQELNNIKINPKNLAKALESNLEIRGEVIMTLSAFNSLNEQCKKEGREPLRNPRNAAAGSIRQLDPRIASSRNLSFYAYEVITKVGQTTRVQSQELASLLGFKVVKENEFCKDQKEIFKFHHYWDNNKKKLPFEVDGVVVKVNNYDIWPKLGIVGKGPRYMMAYKFSAEQVTTVVRDVIWQVGRTGTLTPVATLDPVEVGGVVVSHSTLHNMDEINRLGLKIGDTVILERAGDVIPKVIKVLVELRVGSEVHIDSPKNCPICSSVVTKTKDQVAYKCTNSQCYAVNLRTLSHWASKSALDIEGLGPKIIELLTKNNLVSDISDFYRLKKGDLLSLEGFKEKAATNLLASINAKKSLPREKFLYALGIHHVGEETAILLSKKLNQEICSIQDLAKEIQSLSQGSLSEIKDIGPKVAKSIHNWFHDDHNIKVIARLESLGIKLAQSNTKESLQKLNNQTFVITGTLNKLTREDAKDKIRKLGGSISPSISKKTDYLVAGGSAGSKLEKAKKLNIKILTEQEFENLLKD